jgi:hypothetical protein
MIVPMLKYGNRPRISLSSMWLLYRNPPEIGDQNFLELVDFEQKPASLFVKEKLCSVNHFPKCVLKDTP